MDNDYEQEFMKLVGEFMEQGFSQQEAIEAAKDEIERQRNKFMASAPDAMDERNQVMEAIAMKQFGKPLNELSDDEIIQIEMMIDEMVKRKDQPLPSDPTKPINPFQPKPTGPVLPDRQMAQAGGRIGFQTGGTEYTEQRTLPPEFIEAAQQTYLTDLATQSGLPSVTTANVKQPGETDAQFAQRQAQATQFGITKAGMADLAPQVAAQDALQTQAYNMGQNRTRFFSTILNKSWSSGRRKHSINWNWRRYRSRIYSILHVTLPTTSHRYNDAGL